MNQKNFDDGVNFEVANVSQTRAIFYAVTRITSPEETRRSHASGLRLLGQCLP